MIFVIIVFSVFKHLSEVLLCLFHCIAVMAEVCRCHVTYVHRIVIVVRLLHGVESGVHLPTRRSGRFWSLFHSCGQVELGDFALGSLGLRGFKWLRRVVLFHVHIDRIDI